MNRLSQLLPVVLLLLLQFGLRGYAPELQVAYVDEGFHLRRSLDIYDFDQNPARESHGKLLLYFWMGLFDTGDPKTMLPVGRLSIAIFSVITGAGLYLLGRIFGNHRAGIITLAIYAIMPLAVYFERMALADPLASGLMVLVVWRSYVFAKRPSNYQGASLGIIIALATLAKLTVALAVLFPVIAIIVYGPRRRNWTHYARTYWLPLILSGVMFCLIWSPFALPAFFARNSDDPFVLVNNRNVNRTENDPNSIGNYVELLMPALGNFMLDDSTLSKFGIVGHTITLPNPLRFHVVWLIVSLWVITFPLNPRHHIYIGIWFIAITILLVSLSSFVSSRYFVPIAAPLSLVIGLALHPKGLSSHSPILQTYYRVYRRVRWLVGLLVCLWVLMWVIPFIHTTLTAPDNLPFDSSNWLEYHSGILIADDATAAAARYVNRTVEAEPIISTWNLCHLIFFYIDEEITCIPQRDTPGHLVRAVQDLDAGESLLFLSSGYPAFYEEWDFISHDIIAEYDHVGFSRPIQVIRITIR